MSSNFDPGTLENPRLQRAAQGFIDYCDEAFEWRRNADEPFDQELYEEARQMVLRAIEALDGVAQGETTE